MIGTWLNTHGSSMRRYATDGLHIHSQCTRTRCLKFTVQSHTTLSNYRASHRVCFLSNVPASLCSQSILLFILSCALWRHAQNSWHKHKHINQLIIITSSRYQRKHRSTQRSLLKKLVFLPIKFQNYGNRYNHYTGLLYLHISCEYIGIF